MQHVCGMVHLAVKEIVSTFVFVTVTPLERVVCHDCWLMLVVVDGLPVLLHHIHQDQCTFILHFIGFKQLQTLFGVFSHELAASVGRMDILELLRPKR